MYGQYLQSKLTLRKRDKGNRLYIKHIENLMYLKKMALMQTNYEYFQLCHSTHRRRMMAQNPSSLGKGSFRVISAARNTGKNHWILWVRFTKELTNISPSKNIIEKIKYIFEIHALFLISARNA